MEACYLDPAHWPTSSPPAAILLMPSETELRKQVAKVAWERGFGAFPRTGEDPERIFVPDLPVFDDMLALWFLLGDAPDDLEPTHALALCGYASQVRQALWPRAVPIQLRPHSILEQLRRQSWVNGEMDWPSFQRHSFLLFHHLHSRLVEGRDIRRDNLFDGEHGFYAEMERLPDDAAIYREDRDAAEIWQCTIPQRGRRAREVDLLVLAKPNAVSFWEHAREDREGSPSGRGFALTLVDCDTHGWTLSVDPRLGIRIDFLAAVFQAEDERRDGGALREPWFRGDHLEGTVVAPPHAGTTLGKEDLIELMREHLGLRKPPQPGPSRLDVERTAGSRFHPTHGEDRRKRRWWLLLGVVLTVTSLVVWVAVFDRPAPTSEAVEIVDKGVAVQRKDRERVARANQNRPHFALIVAVNRYRHLPDLEGPELDALELRQLLVDRYGYRPEHIRLLIQANDVSLACEVSGCEQGLLMGGDFEGVEVHGRPTKVNFETQLDAFTEMTQGLEQSSFLLYFSGHGVERRGTRPFAGLVLEPTADPSNERDLVYALQAIDFDLLEDMIEKRVHSRHRLLLLDACYSGHALLAKGTQEPLPDPHLESLWDSDAQVVIAAADTNQRALEVARLASIGLQGRRRGLFTAQVLRGLGVTERGHPVADLDRDGLVTHQEMFHHVAHGMEASLEQLHIQQGGQGWHEPVVRTRHGDAADRGQFLFVPEDWTLPSLHH